ncbi:MAG: hypothetical protein ACOH5I_10430 [Oligoflexus sp.]
MGNFIVRLIVCLTFSGLACSPQEEVVDRRGLTSAALDQQSSDGVQTVDAITDDGPQRAVIIEGDALESFASLAEVDTSLLPADFLQGIHAIHKISATKTIFYGQNQESWLFDESSETAVLSPLGNDVILPPDSRIYVMEEQNFWLVGEATVAFPVAADPEGLGQIALSNVTPELMQEEGSSFKILYVGPGAFILGNEQGRVNVIKREENRARFVNLDLPKKNEEAVTAIAAGIGEGNDHFWFLTANSLMTLTRGSDEQWRWLVSPFQLPLGAEVLAGLKLALFTQGIETPSFAGRTIFQAGSSLFERSALQLSIPDPQLELSFNSEVQPILNAQCAGCHPGFDSFATARAQANAYTLQIAGDTMPPATEAPLGAAEKAILLQWLDRSLGL